MEPEHRFRCGPLSITSLEIRLGPLTFIRSWDWWRYTAVDQKPYGLFRNRKDVRPGRWGGYFLGLEIGSRNPGNPFGVWLKEHGLWPW